MNADKQRNPLAQEHGRRVSAAMRAKAEKGIMPGCAPLGYRNERIDGEKRIVVDPETAPKVRRLFELAGRKKWSLRKLAAEAERMGLRSRNGKKLGPSAIHVILNNPFYTGTVRYEGKIAHGRHKPIIGKVQFESADAALTARSKQPDNLL